jgi:hypothetical protein
MAEEFDLSSLQKEMGVTPKDKQKISTEIKLAPDQPKAAPAPITSNNPGALMPGGKLAQYETMEEGLKCLDIFFILKVIHFFLYNLYYYKNF